MCGRGLRRLHMAIAMYLLHVISRVCTSCWTVLEDRNNK